MCLILKYLEPKIADKDIICYKLVKRTKIKGIYKSEFQEFEYIIRQLYTNNINYIFASKVIKDSEVNCLRHIQYIEEDMFHSFADNIYYLLNPLLHCASLKCIIPKGAYYFEGYFDFLPSYASSQIKILEEI